MYHHCDSWFLCVLVHTITFLMIRPQILKVIQISYVVEQIVWNLISSLHVRLSTLMNVLHPLCRSWLRADNDWLARLPPLTSSCTLQPGTSCSYDHGACTLHAHFQLSCIILFYNIILYIYIYCQAFLAHVRICVQKRGFSIVSLYLRICQLFDYVEHTVQ